uniref:Nucleoprotein TPR-like n=1 Tax=Petromyzon marinus TaxID=7757 RepID=A0AAJ7WKQ8_PETMA
MTLTQMYTSYVEVSDALLAQREETRRATSHLDEILREMQARAPALQQQRRDHDAAVASVAALTAKLGRATADMELMQAEMEECRKEAGRLKRDNQRLQSQAADLGAQVCLLLQQIERERGNPVRDHLEESSSQVSSSGEVIASRLLTFRVSHRVSHRVTVSLTVSLT